MSEQKHKIYPTEFKESSVLNASRSDYYEWIKGLVNNRTEEDKELTAMIRTIFREGHHTYGARRIKKIISRKGTIISRRRISMLMKEANLLCKTKRKFKATTDSNHKLPVAPNLLARQFIVDAANRFWVGDITYLYFDSGRLVIFSDCY